MADVSLLPPKPDHLARKVIFDDDKEYKLIKKALRANTKGYFAPYDSALGNAHDRVHLVVYLYDEDFCDTTSTGRGVSSATPPSTWSTSAASRTRSGRSSTSPHGLIPRHHSLREAR